MKLTDINWLNVHAYIIDPEYRDHLRHELSDISYENDQFIIAPKQTPLPTFVRDVWLNPQLINFDSISHAAKQLQPHHDFWAPLMSTHARRTALIMEKLKQIRLPKQLNFPIKPLPEIAQFTLLDKNTLLFATQREKRIPNGLFQFKEDKENPPNRAYLKLWEALSLLQKHPKPGDFAIDVGSSPGGWTYVLQSLGAKVLSIDKAPLDPKISALPKVTFKQQSAFALQPTDFEQVDWFVGDIACYPERLYSWIMPWIESGKVKQFILTIKLQGDNDLTELKRFQSIPGARILHLNYNKHEVTLFV
jgi:23S rRNA (cytidine2498-2'-O)-methyltransferase